ncbi:MAG TPA: ribonuclease P protein component [Nitrosospira sp.]
MSVWGYRFSQARESVIEESTIRFPKSHRLRQADEFSSVLRLRCSANGEFLQVFAKPNNLVHSRLGLIIAGKVERLAVNRNRAKRLLREIFRTRQQELAGLDLVVRLRCRVPQSSIVRMAREAEMLMIQLQRCRG